MRPVCGTIGLFRADLIDHIIPAAHVDDVPPACRSAPECVLLSRDDRIFDKSQIVKIFAVGDTDLTGFEVEAVEENVPGVVDLVNVRSSHIRALPTCLIPLDDDALFFPDDTVIGNGQSHALESVGYRALALVNAVPFSVRIAPDTRKIGTVAIIILFGFDDCTIVFKGHTVFGSGQTDAALPSGRSIANIVSIIGPVIVDHIREMHLEVGTHFGCAVNRLDRVAGENTVQNVCEEGVSLIL